MLVLVLAFGALGLIATAAAVRSKTEGHDTYGRFGDIAFWLSKLPSNFIDGVKLILEGQKADLAAKNPDWLIGKAGFAAYLDAPRRGTLVLSRYDGDAGQSVVEIVDLATFQVIHRIAPDFAALRERSTLEVARMDLDAYLRPGRYRMNHPLIEPGGGVVFQGTSPLARLDPCGGIDWTIDRLFHHSVEHHPDGGYITSMHYDPPRIDNVTGNFIEDVIVHVSPEGQILYEKSVPELLLKNGLAHWVFGLDFYSDDPVHLNDVEVAPNDGPHWRAGDMFLSLRNVSAIVQYRPSENRVIWYRQGPWVNQHDVDLLDDNRLSVFDNRRFNGARGPYVDGANDVMIYDFRTDRVTSPWRAALARERVQSFSEGRSQVLGDGGVFVEESNYGRILVLDGAGNLVWDYVNRADNGSVYILSWSRILPDVAPESLAPVAGSCG